MENVQNQAMPKAEQKPVAKAERPVHPKTGLPIRIIGPNCEFCGVNATRCQHTEAFRATGMLQKSVAIKEEEKIYQNFPGLPRVIAKICEFCGVDAKSCAHGAKRRELAKSAQASARTRVEIDPVNGARIHIKEPENKEVVETKMTPEQKQQLAASKVAAAQEASKPTPTDDEVSGKLERALSDESAGIGEADEDVDV